VPRLGSYLAIRLEYDSCLSEEAFDAGIASYLSIQKRREEQEEEKKHWAEQQKELQEQYEADGDKFVPEEKEWEEITNAPFLTSKVEKVVCLNSLGQDRQFTKDEILFAQRTVRDFSDQWSKLEETCLRRDIERKISTLESDKHYREVNEPLDQAELDNRAEVLIAPAEGADPIVEELKSIELRKTKFVIQTKTFYDPEGAVSHQRKLDREALRNS